MGVRAELGGSESGEEWFLDVGEQGACVPEGTRGLTHVGVPFTS